MSKREKNGRGMGETCPCGSGAARGACCGSYLDGEAVAPTAQALMRSRYSAFVEGRREYLLRTWAEETRPGALELDPGQHWLGLSIRATTAGGAGDDVGECGVRGPIQGQWPRAALARAQPIPARARSVVLRGWNVPRQAAGVMDWVGGQAPIGPQGDRDAGAHNGWSRSVRAVTLRTVDS